MIRQLDMRLEEKLVENPEIFKTISKSVAKQLKIQQRTQVTTWAGKTTKDIVKQLVTKKLQVGKAEMEE